MNKEKLKELLKDPEIVELIKDIVKPNYSKLLNKSEIRKLENVIKWWGQNGGCQIKIEKLAVFQKIEILKTINSKGVAEFKKIMIKALQSPLRKNGSMMKQYLDDFTWCGKQVNFDKISGGRYDVDHNSKNQEFMNDDNSSEFNGLLE